MGRRKKTSALEKAKMVEAPKDQTGKYTYVPELDDPPISKEQLDALSDEIQEKQMNQPFSDLPKQMKIDNRGNIFEVGSEVGSDTANSVLINDLLLTNPISKIEKQVVTRPCYIIGGGHSWEPYRNLLAIHKDMTFGCSGIPLVFPELRCWYSCDRLHTEPMNNWFWNGSRDTMKVLCYEAWKDEQVPDDCYVTRTPQFGPMDNPREKGLWHGCSSVIGAMEIARLLGYSTFFLFGVDYTETSHPFDTVDPKQAENKKPWDRERVQRHWAQVASAYKGFQCNVFNCNKDSLLVKLNIQAYMDPTKAFSG